VDLWTHRPVQEVCRLRKRTRAREYALQLLYEMDITGDSAGTVLGRFWQRRKYNPEVRDFAAELVGGTFANLTQIDALIAEHSEHWEMDRMPTIDRNILRLGVYELLYRDDIPPKVAINEAVELAHKFSTSDSGKFVNGILDKVMTFKQISVIDSE